MQRVSKILDQNPKGMIYPLPLNYSEISRFKIFIWEDPKESLFVYEISGKMKFQTLLEEGATFAKNQKIP